jgi:hypothetical protein
MGRVDCIKELVQSNYFNPKKVPPAGEENGGGGGGGTRGRGGGGHPAIMSVPIKSNAAMNFLTMDFSPLFL